LIVIKIMHMLDTHTLTFLQKDHGNKQKILKIWYFQENYSYHCQRQNPVKKALLLLFLYKKEKQWVKIKYC